MPPSVEGIPLTLPQFIISTSAAKARALGDVPGVHIATATEQVLAGDLEAGIGELTKAQGNPEADRLRNQWERLRLNRQGLVVLGVAQDIARVLAGAETFDAVPHQPTWQKLEQAISSGKSFSQAYSNLSDEEKTHIAKSLGGHGFLTQLCQIASASHLEILSQQLLALASSYNLSEGHEAGA
ncbi:MAG: hypothetical protein HYU97_01480, partial [Deltaproteobacteria bacterium]|nr:hypothetical protein [Deltaproteobacteria bacterium]